MTLALRYAARSDVGLVRQANEDSGYAAPHLLVVADGMGGHAAGELASATVVATLAELVDGDRLPLTDSDALPELESAVKAAGASIGQVITEEPDLAGMGTTLTGTYLLDHQLAIVHVGDSRADLLRGHGHRAQARPAELVDGGGGHGVGDSCGDRALPRPTHWLTRGAGLPSTGHGPIQVRSRTENHWMHFGRWKRWSTARKFACTGRTRHYLAPAWKERALAAKAARRLAPQGAPAPPSSEAGFRHGGSLARDRIALPARRPRMGPDPSAPRAPPDSIVGESGAPFSLRGPCGPS